MVTKFVDETPPKSEEKDSEQEEPRTGSEISAPEENADFMEDLGDVLVFYANFIYWLI